MTAKTDSIDLSSVAIPCPPGRLTRFVEAFVAPWRDWFALFALEAGEPQANDEAGQRDCPHCGHPMTQCRSGSLPATSNCYECAEGRRDAIYLTALSWQSSIF